MKKKTRKDSTHSRTNTIVRDPIFFSLPNLPTFTKLANFFLLSCTFYACTPVPLVLAGFLFLLLFFSHFTSHTFSRLLKNCWCKMRNNSNARCEFGCLEKAWMKLSLFSFSHVWQILRKVVPLDANLIFCWRLWFNKFNFLCHQSICSYAKKQKTFPY